MRPEGSTLVTCAVLAATLGAATASAANDEPSTEIRAFRPQADTYVSAAQPERNFGGTQTLRVDGSPEATIYLRFRLRKLEGEVTGVTLLLHPQAGARTSYQVRRVYENEWREGWLTYENAPELSHRYAASRPVRHGAWNAVDVSAFVDDDDERVSLAITTTSPRAVVFASRESKRSPRLVVRTKQKDSKDSLAGS